MKPIKPMEPVITEEAFDDGNHVFQIKWDGVRGLTLVDDGVHIYNRHLRDKTRQYPDLIQMLSGLPKGTLLDGEIVALDDSGHPSFPQVMARDALISESKIQQAVRRNPVMYMVFDVLYWKGESMMVLPWNQRDELLQDILEPFSRSPVQKVDSFIGEGVSLFQAACKNNLEGIVAKRMDSPYLPGQKSELWRKVKCWRTLMAPVLGYLENEGRLRSLILGLQEGDRWNYIGNAYSGLDQKSAQALHLYLCNLSPLPSPFPVSPPLAEPHYVASQLLAEVRYAEWSREGRLRHPTILRILEDSHVQA